MSLLSTPAQFLANCPSLCEDYSGIVNADILLLISDADLIVRFDVSPYYEKKYIEPDVFAFNLLSQYKTAQIGMERYYATTRNIDSKDIAEWKLKYDQTLKCMKFGFPILNKEGEEIPLSFKNICYKKQE